MAETDITLAVDLDVVDAEKTAKQLQKEVEDIFKSRKSESSASLTNLEIQMKKSYDTASALQSKLEELKKTDPVPTADYSELVRQEEEIGTKIEELLAKRDALLAEGVLHPSDKRLIEVNAQLDKLGAAYDDVYDSMQAMRDAGTAYVVTETTEEYQKLQGQIDITNDKLKQQLIHYHEIAESSPFKEGQSEVANMNKNMMSISMTMRGLSRIIPGVSAKGIMGVTMLARGVTRLTHLTKEQLVGAVKTLKKVVIDLFNLILAHPVIALIAALTAGILVLFKKIKEKKEELKKDLEELFNVVTDGFKKIGAVAVSALKKIVSGLATIKNFLTNAISKGIKSLFNKIYVQGILGGLKAIVNKLISMRSLIVENLKLMAKWNDGNNDVNKSLSNITSSLSYLRASITTAFAPILTTIEPILTKIIDLLAEAATAVGMFIASLTGQSTFQRAIRKQKDYAKSLKETNSQLAAFDKLNVINQKQDDSDDVGFDLIDVESISLQKQAILDWFDTLETKGKEVGENVTKFLNGIPWDEVKTGAGEAGQAIAEFFNGLNKTDVGLSIGVTFGESVNTITSAINGFLEELSGSDLGQQISDLLTGFVTTVEWGDFGDTFSGLLDKLIDIICEVFETDKDGENLGSRVGDALNEFLSHALSFNWDKASVGLASIVTNLQSFFDKLFNKDGQLKWENLGKKMGKFIRRASDLINWDKVGNTLFNGFKSALKLMRGFIEGLSGTKTAKAVSDFLAGALQHDKLTWDEIEADMNAIGQQIVDFLNGFITEDNFRIVSNALTRVLTALFTTIKLFGDEAEWEQWGQAIATAADEFFGDDKMWENMTLAVKSFTTGIFNLICTAIDGINWYGEGEGEGGWNNSVAGRIIQFLADIDWTKIADTVYHVSSKLYEGFSKLWDQLKANGTFDNIIKLIVTVLSEAYRWKKAFQDVKSEVIKSVFEEQFKSTFEAIGLYLLDCIFHPFTKRNFSDYLNKAINGGGSEWHISYDSEGNMTKSTSGKFDKTWFSKTIDSIDELKDEVKKNTKETKNANNNYKSYQSNTNGAYTGAAGGAVIPPYASQRLIKVGDNNHEPEVISPLSTIKQALVEALGETGGSKVTFEIVGDPHGMFKVMQKESVNYNQRTGNTAFA